MTSPALKILYAVQATGNGHIARATELYPYLTKYGQVDFFLSGNNYSLSSTLPIKYRSKGLSLFYRNDGKLDYFKIIFQTNFLKLYQEAKKLPVQHYDIVISDFEFITYLSCLLKGKRFFHMGHQASFYSQRTPRPQKIKILSNWILRNYCKSKNNIGFHFSNYETWILPPVIKQKLWDVTEKHPLKQTSEPISNEAPLTSNLIDPINQNNPANNNTHKKKICIYLPQYSPEQIRRYIYGIHHVQFQIFHPQISTNYSEGDLNWMKIDNDSFSQSLIESDGVICGAGFETPAEALFLEKELLVIPIKGQFEQYCNAEALKKMGVEVIDRLDLHFYDAFNRWIMNPRDKKLKPNFQRTDQMVEHIFSEFLIPSQEIEKAIIP